MYLIGEPIFDTSQERKTFLMPAGQKQLCLEVLKETADRKVLHETLTAEYLAIIWGLREMGVDFRIVFAHPDKIDERIVNICAQHLGCRFSDFRGFYPPSVVYPRDFSTIIPGILLVNEYVQVVTPEKNGWKIMVSPWGEGGRILSTPGYAVVPERICGDNAKSLPVEERHLRPLREAGIRVLFLPPPLLYEVTTLGKVQSISFNDHLDRVACMLRDKKIIRISS